MSYTETQYYIKNKSTNTYMQVTSGNQGTPLVLAAKSEGSGSQLWIQQGSNSDANLFLIVSPETTIAMVFNGANNQILLNYGNIITGAPILWSLPFAEGGYFYIQSSDDTTQVATASGSNVVANTKADNNDAQLWYFEEVVVVPPYAKKKKGMGDTTVTGATS